MRHLIRIITESSNNSLDVEKAIEGAIGNLDMSSGDRDTIIWEFHEDNSIIQDEDEDFDTENEYFKTWLHEFFEERAEAVRDDIAYHFKGDHIRCWRMITAPSDWKLTGHPGVYWSYIKDAAEAHGGNFIGGHVEWLIEALIPKSSIDFVTSYAQNASLNYENESEIKIFDNAPINIVSVTQV